MTSHLLDLVYVPLARHFNSARVVGSRVELVRKSDSPFDSEALAASFTDDGVVSVRSTPAGIEVLFGDPDQAARVGLEATLLALGPYTVASYSPEELVLRRRAAGSGPDTIEAVSMGTAEEEWRRLLGREVDIVPSASPAHLRYLREVPSVRVRPVAHPATAALWFNTRGGSRFADARLRQAIARTIRRRAIAEVVTGDADSAVLVQEDIQSARALLAAVGKAPTFTVLVPDSFSDFQRVALVLHQQLAIVNAEVTIAIVTVGELQQRSMNGDFDALLLWGELTPRTWPYLVSTSIGDFCGYASKEFDAAAAARDERRARAILETDVPFTPLYVQNDGVALDAALCGAHPQYTYDLSWLADVHRCAPGETE